jgi:hypothetical protein
MSRKKESSPLLAISERPKLDQFAAGEYWFASADFVAFATSFPVAHAVLGHLCALKSVEMNICVRATDKNVAERFASQYRGGVQLRILPDEALLLLGQIIRIDPSGKASLYVPDESGFLFLNTTEAVGIRSTILEWAVAA